MDYSERVQRRYIDLTKPMIPFHFLLQRCVSIRLLMSSCCLDLFGTYQYQYEKLLWESVTQYVSVCVCLCVWHYSTRMRWHTYIHTNIYFNIYPSISYHLMALSSSFCSSLFSPFCVGFLFPPRFVVLFIVFLSFVSVFDFIFYFYTLSDRGRGGTRRETDNLARRHPHWITAGGGWWEEILLKRKTPIIVGEQIQLHVRTAGSIICTISEWNPNRQTDRQTDPEREREREREREILTEQAYAALGPMQG